MDDLAVHEAMGAALMERGLATQGQVTEDRASLEAALRGETPPAEPAAKPAPPGADAVPAGVDPLDAAMFAGPPSADHYRFDLPPEGVAPNVEQAQQFREFFHAEGVPVPIANEIGKLWNKAIAKPPNAGELEHGRQAGMTTLGKIWGADRDANLAIAQREVQRMEKARPGLAQMLEVSGLGNSAWLAETLVQMARAKGRHG